MTEIALDNLLGWAAVKRITGLSRTTIWRLQRAGSFPQSIAISPGRVAWREREVAAWQAGCGQRLDPPPPAKPRQPNGGNTTSASIDNAPLASEPVAINLTALTSSSPGRRGAEQFAFAF